MQEKEVAYSTSVADEAAPEETAVHLKNLKLQHQWDPNLPDEVADEIDEALHTTDKGAREGMAHELLDDSPYPEVRAAVPNYDEGGHTNTIRAWTIGLIFATIGSALNMLFSMRNPYIVIPSYVAQVVAYPVGVAWAKFMPNKQLSLFGRQFNLNPGPFSKKEHALIVIMANATFGGGAAYATDVLLAQRAFYKQSFGWGFEILMCISTQMLGFGLAGFFHRFLVAPAAMIWPSNLINCALFTALHDTRKPDPSKVNGWTIGKYRFFLYVMIGSFCWYFFPGLIAPFLSYFAWVTWIKPQNPVVNQLFGGETGLSLIPMTFDWTQVSGFNFSPLIAPWHAIANTLIGMVIFFWIVTAGIHYSGTWFAQFLPISDSSSYDNTATTYNVSRIMTPEFTLDLKAYEEYSPLFLSTTFALCYGLSFATIIALLVNTGLFHGSELWVRFRNFGKEEEDVHGRLMARFKPVPLWWYGGVVVAMIAIGLGLVLGYPTHLDWWAFFVALIIAVIWYVPIGIIQASTNIALGLNVLTEFIVGYIQPGKPMAMMLFKTYGYMSMYQGLYFNQDMKLGHYMKIPPRVSFAGQMVAALWSSIVQIAVMNWGLATIKDVCSLDQPNHYTCPNGRVFFNASVIWGLIGPQRMFSPGQMYVNLQWFWLAGALLPVIVYLAARMWPKSKIRYLSAPLIFGGAGLIPPATPLNYLTWGIVGMIFNKYIRDKFRGWWMHYNYILSAGLDVGLDLCTILIFLTIDLTGASFPDWWGTRIASGTMDTMGTAIQTVLTNGTFGPTKW
ncbi:small oligopeptide transporter [Aspergillus japonicus CBS 114.51]|uniref:Small oligopeptide transporter n=2 Tax=Aspergillus TaxID=5052 RepID=A0A2V5I1T6_ASPV1|nr:small oligopeptide transporter [Aspergillus japonicus CBS 114.51]PYI18067.1 small oligopeptide transporter [Aspergillus violaceofuscus CBS 115571]RAH75868.1 small oligopeptide transporter [Aspergillus japonicus CBS 114.51]